MRNGDSPTTLTTSFGRLFGPVGTFSIFLKVSIPSTTLPKTTCFPSKKSHFAVVMKNWEIDVENFSDERNPKIYLGPVGVWAGIRLDNAERSKILISNNIYHGQETR